MNKRLPLTIVTAVLNEEENLPSYLEHITKIAEEVIIVVDYRTVDKSAQIAKRFNCKVLQDKGDSRGIVFINKNWGIDEAKYPWIMIMDADERISPQLQSEITDVVTTKIKTQANLFQTGFLNYEFGRFFKKCDQPQKKFIRLFRKGSFRYQYDKTAEGFDIHAKAIDAKRKSTLLNFVRRFPGLRSYFISKDPNIMTFKGLLIHNSHPTIHDFIRKIDLYSSREAKIYLKAHPLPSKRLMLFNLMIWPIREFLYKYVVWSFYREGLHGFVAATLYGVYRFLTAAKIYSFSYKRRHAKSIEALNEFGFVGMLDEA